MLVAAAFGDGSAGLIEQHNLKPKEDYVLIKVVYTATCTEYKYLALIVWGGKSVRQDVDPKTHVRSIVMVRIGESGKTQTIV